MAGASLSVGRIPNGYCLRLVGRCTMNESPAAHEFAERAIRDGGGSVFIDVSDCTYLDSTFLGSLLDLHRKHGKDTPPRMTIVATPESRKKLFEALHLHKVFNFADSVPQEIDAWVELPSVPHRAPDELAQHVMECHRRLAEIDGPNQASFAAVAQQLERELSKSPEKAPNA